MSYMWIELNGLKVEAFFREAGLLDNQLIFTQSLSPTNNNLYVEIKHIIDNSTQSSIHVIAHLFLFFDALIELSTKSKHMPSNQVNELYISEDIHFIETNYALNITVNDIADHCNLNRHYFSRLFRKK